ncbi:MAG TPA: BlaI/MecI/CopY family transcriptional regulator [Pirellulales bacterium]|nr:BlaI/MecI/CopY family transcriptional regulator [Pirellulales bacterium]
MARAPQDVTDAELAILEVLWRRSSATVREIAEELYAGCNTSQHATVQKLLERLEGKKCVRRDRDNWPHTFEPAIERGELIGRKLQQTADRLCEGSVQPLLMHLVKAGRLSADERRSLRELLDQLDTKGGKSAKKK